MKEKELIVVESPTKAKTLRKLLGENYLVEASFGHIKDLPEKRLGVRIEEGFSPEYELIKGKERVIRNLKNLARLCSCVILATDPDREGEAIAWHIAEELGHKVQFQRALIYEFTPQGIKEALSNLTSLRENLYRAQQARRVLDRLVGYKVSPLLWKALGGGLSAGRVQSAALRLLYEREKEIKDFVPKEYWTLKALLEKDGFQFWVKLGERKGKKIALLKEEEAKRILEELKGKSFYVLSFTKEEKSKKPPPPFITSTLQQEASKLLGLSLKQTMAIAQRLYEGLPLGPLGQRGLITYMRTDSVRISPLFQKAARDFILRTYGKEFLPPKPHTFKSPSKAQEAHEAIRPTSLELFPERVRPYLKIKEFELYELIWRRFLASQMAELRLEVGKLRVKCGDFTFQGLMEVEKFPGFMIVWEGEKEEKKIPDFKEGEELLFVKIEVEKHLTQPPPRYSEASLVKELEKRGIGRPSTYATIITTLMERGYVRLQNKAFHLTELGEKVAQLLLKHFPTLMDLSFTNKMEEELDRIANGLLSFREVLASFYGPFSKDLQKAHREIKGDGSSFH